MTSLTVSGHALVTLHVALEVSPGGVDTYLVG